MAALASEGRTIFLSTHLLDVAEKTCHKVAIIREGSLQAVGAPGDLGGSLEDLFLRVTE
jgi:ABC-2 type transport system ATP-binding protein